MYPSDRRDLIHDTLEGESEGIPAFLDAAALRYSWRVKDCLICSWYELPGPYSVDEMWRFLVEGRFSDARRVESRNDVPTS
ncbi:MAG TPA: hypothetical protein VMH26_05340 [Burkholderiales bacterium]|nr:hypothetical protein [Burkholderiales bacterium]